jgi:hypothetical protein
MGRMLRMKLRLSVLWLCLSVASQASAQSAQQTVEDLNRGAMEAYNSMDIDKAGAMLEEALRVAAQGGVAGPLLAQTNINLAIVYIGGLGDNEGGTKYFADALCADPSAQLDPLTSTPDIQSVFQAAQQRVQQTGCANKGGNLSPGAAAATVPVGNALTHYSPPEQLTQTPLPLYAEVSNAARAKTVYLYYKGMGMEQFKRVAMLRYGQGYAYQVSCNDVFEPQVQYYIEAVGSGGAVVGGAGSAAEPVTVPVVSSRTQAEPALPNASSPASCATAECPPGMEGCAEAGTNAIGDRCSSDSECQSGLFCEEELCALKGAGGGDESYSSDDEAPPGWGDENEPDDGNPKDFKRGFFQLGLALGMTYVQAGMVADRPPPEDLVFVQRGTGAKVIDPLNNTTVKIDDYLFAGTKADPMQANLIIPDPATETAWVPDADSADAAGEIGGECAGDGTATGPDPDLDLLPSRYCVRVKAPGFAAGMALRAALGYFITDHISLALINRFQFSAGEGTLSSMLIGARGEYMFNKPKPKGLMVSAFLGLTFGQIQAQLSTGGNSDDLPWVKSGLQGTNLGMAFRYRFHKNFGMFMAPELDLQFPTFLWHIDLTFAGVEAAF